MKSATMLFLFAAALAAQEHYAEALLRAFNGYQQNIEETIAKVHEGYLDFRPTAEVKSMREHIGHVLDGHYGMCAQLRGEANPNKTSLEKAALSKAALLEAAKSAGAYCAATLKQFKDAQGGEPVKLSNGSTRTKAYTAVHLVEHAGLHYGNLITYMRLRGMTPPETERRKQAAAPAKFEMVTYYMGFLKRGPKWTGEATAETAKIQEGHMAHMKKSADAGHLILAGPFADNTDLRGILVYKTKTLEEAKAIAELDPAVQSGRLVVELHPWMTQKGYLP